MGMPPPSIHTDDRNVVSYRDNVLFEDHRLVKSQQCDVILECCGVVRLMDRLALNLVVFVWKPLALVSYVPLSETNLKFQPWSFLKHQLKIL